MKTLFNKWANSRVDEYKWIGKGDKVEATVSAAEWDFSTKRLMQYKVLIATFYI